MAAVYHTERTMSRITLGADAAVLLEAARAKAELCGPDGRRLGYFVPADDDDVTLDELRAADAAGGEYTVEDVLKLLEKNR